MNVSIISVLTGGSQITKIDSAGKVRNGATLKQLLTLYRDSLEKRSGNRRAITAARLGALSIIMALALLPAPLARAQSRATTGDITGTVTDASKAVFPNASITATDSATGFTRSTRTDDEGRFFIPALPVGIYRVSAEAVGFARQDINDVVLVLGSSVKLLVTMQVLGILGQVDVNGTPLVDVRKTEISNAVLQQQIVNLPINGRNFVAFALITPGISTDRTPAQGPTATSGLTFAGQSARANNIMVDGVDNTEAALGSVRGTFSQEAVREFQVLTNSFSAEFGKATGGIVNILTRSGTNSFAGSAFLYYRNDVLNAKSYFERFNPAGQRIDPPKAPFDQKQFGATFGGPLRKNRTFFFTSFERLKIDANNFVNIDNQTVVANPNGGAPLGTPADILRAAGFQFDLGNVPYAVRGNQFLLKVDHEFSNRQSAALRLNYADFFDENSEPFGGITAKSNAGALNSDDYALVASHTAFVSSSLFNETRFQYAFREQNFLALDPACGGPCLDETQGGPTIEVAGIGNLGRQRATPQPRSASRYQLLDTVTFIKDSHQLKLGFDFSFIANKSSIPLQFGGRYIFAALPAIPGVRPALSPIQAVALGLPSLYIQGYGDSRGDYDYKDISAFAEDHCR